MDGTDSSAGMTASDPYVRENGVSPVDERAVVRYDQRTPDSSSAHAPFAFCNRFFEVYMMVLFDDSAW